LNNYKIIWHVVNTHDQQFAAGSSANSGSQMSYEICDFNNMDVTHTEDIKESRIDDPHAK